MHHGPKTPVRANARTRRHDPPPSWLTTATPESPRRVAREACVAQSAGPSPREQAIVATFGTMNGRPMPLTMSSAVPAPMSAFLAPRSEAEICMPRMLTLLHGPQHGDQSRTLTTQRVQHNHVGANRLRSRRLLIAPAGSMNQKPRDEVTTSASCMCSHAVQAPVNILALTKAMPVPACLKTPHDQSE